MGWQWLLHVARSDERWRLARRLLDRGLRPGSTTSYRPMLQSRAYVLLSRLLANPDRWEAHVELSVELLSGPYHVTELLGKWLAFRES